MLAAHASQQVVVSPAEVEREDFFGPNERATTRGSVAMSERNRVAATRPSTTFSLSLTWSGIMGRPSQEVTACPLPQVNAECTTIDVVIEHRENALVVSRPFTLQ